jgi:transposase
LAKLLNREPGEGELAVKNYIFWLGVTRTKKTLVNKIAHNDGPLETKRFSARRAGRQKLIENLRERSRQAGGAQVVVAYEASSHGFILCDELRAAGFLCHVLAPTKIERSIKQKRNKNDDRDAERLLDIVRGHYSGSDENAGGMGGGPANPRRPRTGSRTARSERETDDRKNPGANAAEATGNRETRRRWHQLDEALPAMAGGAQREGPAIQSGMRQTLKSLLRQLQFLEHEIEQMDQAMRELANTPRRKPIVDELMKEKGVGLATAMKYVTDIGDFKRFSRGRQIGAFFGLVPSTAESGENNDRKGHITREGSPSARKVLCQATWSRVQHDKQERDVYRRLVARNPKKKKIALVACMRRLAVRLWHIGFQAQLKMEAAG